MRKPIQLKARGRSIVHALLIKPAKPLNDLRADKRGAVLPMMCVGLVAMVAAIGGGIDIGRAYIVKSQLQAGVDAAALAGARSFGNEDASSPTNRDAQVKAYFLGNFPNDYMGSTTPPGVTAVEGTTSLLPAVFEVVNGINRTTVTARAAVPCYFMGIFGAAPIDVTVVARAELQPRPLEVMVVLDNTGSMNESVSGGSKIGALKTAMKSFIDVLFQGSTERKDLAVGIINYTVTTNVGRILKDAGVTIDEKPGFTLEMWESGDPYGWKGCVSNDDTVRNMSATVTAADADAFDIYNNLPGDTNDRPGHTRSMGAIQQFLYPPAYFPAYPKDYDKTKVPGWKLDEKSVHYTVKDSTITPSGSSTLNKNADNLYPALSDPNFGTIANSSLYKRYFYRIYIGLNADGSTGTNAANDVITTDTGEWWDPAKYNSFTDIGDTTFVVHPERITELTTDRPKKQWNAPTLFNVASSNTQYPSPNWQCPQAGLKIEYGRDKQKYVDFINNQVWGVYPANGTMHHIGFIWGYRMLSRFDVFERERPSGTSVPKRALVFMTDGMSALSVADGASDKTWTAYGTPDDHRLVTGTGSFIGAVDRRFAKACAIANLQMLSDGSDPPPIYVVVINKGSDVPAASQAMLKNCGSGGYWLTTSADSLNQAFTSIAADLVDLHLTQ